MSFWRKSCFIRSYHSYVRKCYSYLVVMYRSCYYARNQILRKTLMKVKRCPFCTLITVHCQNQTCFLLTVKQHVERVSFSTHYKFYQDPFTFSYEKCMINSEKRSFFEPKISHFKSCLFHAKLFPWRVSRKVALA